MRLFLIHGQGRTFVSMMLLGYRLQQQGHQIDYFSYSPPFETFEQITNRFVRRVRANPAGQPYAIVSHSLGGLVARASLPQLEDRPPRQLVMLAPPNRPARMAKIARYNPLYNWFTRDCGCKLADDTFYATLPYPAIPTTIIAGVNGPRGRFSPFGQEPNDWILTVPETSLGQEVEVIVTPTNHTLIMFSTEVARLVGNVISGASEQRASLRKQ